MHDTPDGFFVEIADQTTGQTGTMTAGAGNGWRHIVWDPKNFNCKGEPYSFHPMFDTAAPPYPERPAEVADVDGPHYNVSMSDEIGHFETPDQHGDGNPRSGPATTARTFAAASGRTLTSTVSATRPIGPTARKSSGAGASPPRRAATAGRLVGPSARSRFEADIPAVDQACDVITGAGCTVPPTVRRSIRGST